MSNAALDPTKVSFITIDDNHAGQRLDNFLLGALKGAPKSLIYRIIRKGEVRINKGRAKADSRLELDDVVRIPPIKLPEKKETPAISGQQLNIIEQAIIYEDAGLLAVNKPAGLAVHGGSGISLGLIESLRQMRPSHSFLELVHRLDRDTSGLVLVAKKRSVLTALQRMLANKQGIRKTYWALVHGHWPLETTYVDLPLKKIEPENAERIVLVANDGKESLTRTKLLVQGAHYSLVEAEPITGRTHQIRVHCQSQGLAIAGDEKYRDKVQIKIDEQHQIKRLMLHAYQLGFRHPQTGEQLLLTAPLGNEFARVLKNEGCYVEI